MQLATGSTTRGRQPLAHSQNPQHAGYFMPRPTTTYKSRNVVIERRNSTDAISRRKSRQIAHSDIDFKRQPYHTLQNQPFSTLQPEPQVHEGSPRGASQTLTPPSLPYMQNIRVSVRKYQELIDSSNDIMKSIVREEIISQVQINHPFFGKINPNLTQSLVMIGKIRLYQEEEAMPKLENTIGFVLFGKVKIFNRDYKAVLAKGHTFGQHPLFDCNIRLKAKCLEESCVLWVQIRHYNMLRQQAITHGLRAQFNQLEVALRRSFISKKFNTAMKKSRLA